MAPIRILVVDDSLVVRKMLSDTLSADAELEVVGTAGDGQIALAKIQVLKPDLITLDVEMPVMNGLETLAALRKLYPKMPVIMFSTVTERGAVATLKALSLGASDYATKPSNTSSSGMAIEAIRSDLVPKIKVLCGRKAMSASAPLARPASVSPRRRTSYPPVEIVAIGTSTGGPNALTEILPQIPEGFPVPIVVVQHMPPIFTRLLAERLCSQSLIAVGEGTDAMLLSPAQAWIAPGNFHMTVARAGLSARLQLNQEPTENSCRPSVDVLFRSLASGFGARVLAVVMTGMGSDGVAGAHLIRKAGGEVIIQDESSSIIWGMPGLVYAAGQADAVYPLEQLAGEITRRVQQRRPAASVLSQIQTTLEPRAK